MLLSSLIDDYTLKYRTSKSYNVVKLLLLLLKMYGVGVNFRLKDKVLFYKEVSEFLVDPGAHFFKLVAIGTSFLLAKTL